MDPTDNNPINPTTPAGAPAPAPAPASPADGAGQAVSPAQPAPAPAPAPAAPGQPAVNPVTPPVGAAATPGVASAPASPAPVPPVPVNPVINPAAPGGVGTAEGLLKPEPVPEPDPVEEELKAPMKAAGPAPGSIGSAVSGPAEATAGGQTPSVAFNDPAAQPNMANGAQKPGGTKKTNRKTLIALIVVALLIVAVLAVVLVMQMMPASSPSPNNNNGNTQNTSNTTNTDSGGSSTSGSGQSGGSQGTTTNASTTMSCARSMTPTELADFSDAVSGTISVSATFDADDYLTTVSLVKSVVYSDEDIAQSEPVNVLEKESTSGELTATSALDYYLPVSEDGSLFLSLSRIQTNYESLDFVCEAL